MLEVGRGARRPPGRGAAIFTGSRTPQVSEGEVPTVRWNPAGRSDNLEDRRGASPGGGFRMGGRGVGLGGLLILLILSLVFKRDFLSLAGGLGPAGAAAPAAAPAPVDDPAEEPMVRFVSAVLDSTQATWQRRLGPRWRDAKLVLFRDATQSGCGFAQAATGPFYCPGDGKVYLDLGFYDELDRRFGAPGDFAQAYVLAHEIGHHVQALLGTSNQVHRLQQQRPDQANAASVRLELQADCYAGVWAHVAGREGILEPGDIDEGLRAAAAVGDDRLQRMATGRVQPESFTHGTSAQRARWFRTGYERGDPDDCDTFRAAP